MSSTNRGYDRHKSDYYITPPPEIALFLDQWLRDLQEEDEYNFICERPDKALWLDPCAGGDLVNEMSYPKVLNNLGVTPMTIDIREDSRASFKNDYLKLKLDTKFNVIITNPPFHIAKEIIEKALEDVAENGYVVMLLRLNFLGSKQRYSFWKDNPAKSIYVHHKRMSFTKDGSTDSIEYAHFVWQKGYKGKTIITVI